MELASSSKRGPSNEAGHLSNGPSKRNQGVNIRMGGVVSLTNEAEVNAGDVQRAGKIQLLRLTVCD